FLAPAAAGPWGVVGVQIGAHRLSSATRGLFSAHRLDSATRGFLGAHRLSSTARGLFSTYRLGSTARGFLGTFRLGPAKRGLFDACRFVDPARRLVGTVRQRRLGGRWWTGTPTHRPGRRPYRRRELGGLRPCEGRLSGAVCAVAPRPQRWLVDVAVVDRRAGGATGPARRLPWGGARPPPAQPPGDP